MIDSVIRKRAEAAGVTLDAMYTEYVRATALKRMVLPSEVADAVLFLCRLNPTPSPARLSTSVRATGSELGNDSHD